MVKWSRRLNGRFVGLGEYFWLAGIKLPVDALDYPIIKGNKVLAFERMDNEFIIAL